MVVFGIDPGSTVTGFGVVESRRGRLRHIASGCIRTAASEPMEQRLLKIHDGLVEALGRHTVDAVAIEAIFHHKSAESALRLGQARGVALLAAARHGFSPVPYNAMTVKRSIGAHGKADKNGVARMVGMLLGEVPEGPADVTDALAIAITHINHSRALAAGMTR
ncbi:MAG: crossover junction endodeoxyribonuclease RuvC [Alphaproteobacteria bacterium]|nr:crossover junction endodeoxyribonuclease RuvC [Alphaproteobacteria bacterium]